MPPQQPAVAVPQQQPPMAVPQQQAPYGAQQPQPYAQPYGAPQAPTDSKSTVSVVLGVLSIVFSWTVIIGIVLGIIAIVFAGQSVKAFGKSGKTTGGKVCGVLGIVFSILGLISYIAFGIFLASVANSPTYYNYM